jgi:CBS domain containing-hemolysin-like protein
MHDLLLILLAFLLVLLNGFFVAAEFAIVKLRLTQAEELARGGGYVSRILLSVRSHLDGYLSACQLGITLSSLALGWIGEPAFAHLLEQPLNWLGVAAPAVIHGIAFAAAFSLISFLHIVLGELAPKSLALRKPEAVSLWTATPLWLFYWIMYPFIYVLNGSANRILRWMNVESASESETAHSLDELKQVLAASHQHGELGTQTAKALSRALEFPDLAAGDLMRPAVDMVWLDVNAPLTEALDRIGEHRYSRYPVCDGDRDRVLGQVHVKDLIAQRMAGNEALRAAMRPVLRVHREHPAQELMRQFRSGAPHFALIEDGSGTVAGFVTFNDVLEALLGRVQDEFYRHAVGWRAVADGSYLGNGALSIHSLERLLGIAVNVVEVDSVGGLAIWKLDHIPKEGERAVFERFTIEVRQMKGPKVARVRVIPHASASD